MTERFAPLIPAVALFAAGCLHTFPPPPVPPPGPVDLPRVAVPVAPGDGRVYVDVVDGPTEVRVVTSKTGTEYDQTLGETVDIETLEVQSVCTTPCVFDLPLGRHTLSFPMRGTAGTNLWDDDVDVIAAPSPTVYRRALGWRRSGGAGFALGVLGAVFGGTSFATGAALLPVGLATDHRGLTVAGGITIGVGALLTVLGVWAMAEHPDREQAGAGAQYPLPGDAAF